MFYSAPLPSDTYAQSFVIFHSLGERLSKVHFQMIKETKWAVGFLLYEAHWEELSERSALTTGYLASFTVLPCILYVTSLRSCSRCVLLHPYISSSGYSLTYCWLRCAHNWFLFAGFFSISSPTIGSSVIGSWLPVIWMVLSSDPLIPNLIEPT